MLQDYLQQYLPPSQAIAESNITAMAQRLDVYLNKNPTQDMNCMTPDSKFITFINHTIQFALDLTYLGCTLNPARNTGCKYLVYAANA